MKLTKETLKRIIKEELKSVLNESVNYVIFKDDEDPDYPIISIVPAGVNVNSTQYNEIIGEYESYEVEESLLERIKNGAQEAFTAAANLNVGRPIVSLVYPDDETHLASTTDGTETGENPIIIMGPVRYESEAALETRESILHELGHLYLRRMGKEYEPEEEDIVERYAMSEGRSKWILDNYLKST
jgi:hypothetical protein